MTPKSFTLVAEPGTDIWRKPPSTNIFKAPAHPTPPKPLSQFLSAKATFAAPWEHQYDQAGLLLTFQSKVAAASPDTGSWIKAGLEFYQGIRQLSVVACDRWADWSVTPLPAGADESISIAIEREESAHGVSLWVYFVSPSGEKVPLREICWVFGENEGKDTTLTVAAYTARPEAKAAQENLEVEFRDLAVEWS